MTSAHNATIAEMNAFVANGGSFLAVRDQHERSLGFVGQLAEEIENVFSASCIQITRWFVGEHEGRAVNECSRDCDPLLFAAGKLGGSRGGAFAQTDAGEQRLHASMALCWCDADQL